jgi:hypothetical protein
MISIDDAWQNGIPLPLLNSSEAEKTEKARKTGGDGSRPAKRKRKPENKYTLQEAWRFENTYSILKR